MLKSIRLLGKKHMKIMVIIPSQKERKLIILRICLKVLKNNNRQQSPQMRALLFLQTIQFSSFNKIIYGK